MLLINEYTLTGDVRAAVSIARDSGETVNQEVAFALALADLLGLPDDAMFVPAVTSAMDTSTQLNDPANIAYTAKIARAAGYGKLAAANHDRS